MHVAPPSSECPLTRWLRAPLLLLVLGSLAVTAAIMAAKDRSRPDDNSDYDAAAPQVSYTSPHANAALLFTFANGNRVKYVGMFSADARFRSPSRVSRLSELGAAEIAGQRSAPQSLLRSNERALATVAPPARASAVVVHEGLPTRTLSSLATFVYGHLQVMQSPQTLVTDSRQRVIVADPAIPAVHILDPDGRSSFRLVGGPGRRFESVQHVDVDAEDNIYLADSVRGLVLVFDRDGRFLREIGTYRGEPLFEGITAIAIDRGAGRLYVADGPRDEIVVLDLDGNFIQRAGHGRMPSRPGELMVRDPLAAEEFKDPTDISIDEDKVAVLDNEGTRVRVMDHDCKLVGGFSVQQAVKDKAYGISIDHRGNIFVSYPGADSIREYAADGKLLGSFGYAGFRMGQFLGPEGVWIDRSDRLYVADTENARIEIFQLTSER